MHTPDENLPEPFEGVDGQYYSYVNPRDLHISTRTKNRDKPAEFEIVTEYEYVLTDSDEDELMMDKYVMAQQGASAGVDYEFMLYATNWVNIRTLKDHESFDEKIREAASKRQRGILVTEAFADKLRDIALVQVQRYSQEHPEGLPRPPKLQHPGDLLDNMFHEQKVTVDTSKMTRKEARERIAIHIDILKEKHLELATLPPAELPVYKFSPPVTMFRDLRIVEQDAVNKLHQQDLCQALDASINR